MGLKVEYIRGVTTVARRSPEPVGYHSFTIAATANNMFDLADAGFPLNAPARAVTFQGVLETAQIRVRGLGTSPTTTEGQVMNPGDVITLSKGEFLTTRFIRTGGTSGVIKGHFYDAELV